MARKPGSTSSASTPSSRPSKPSSSAATSNPSQPSASSKPTPPPPSSSSLPKPTTTSSSTASSTATTTPLTSKSTPSDIAHHIWHEYLHTTPSRTFLLDAFMAFLVVIGVVQFIYAVLFGNYPFNAFLSGFSAAVGQFVLTASLRLQTVEKAPMSSSAASKRAPKNGDGEGESGDSRVASSERAFADFVFGSLILHGFCVNFIN